MHGQQSAHLLLHPPTHHSSAEPSLLAEAAHWPSGEKATAHTSLEWLRSTWPGRDGSWSGPA